MSVLLEFSMIPLDKGESLSQYVSGSLDIIDKSGLKYQFTPMATILEGEWDDVIGVLTSCYNHMSKDCNRISCSVKIDARKGKEGRLKAKTRKVETILNRELEK